MNRGCFRLLYSSSLAMFVPVAESLIAKEKNKTGKRLRKSFAFCASVLMLSNCFNAIAAPISPNTLPIPNSNSAITYGTGSIATSVSNPNLMTVTQSTNKMIVEWNSFNIGSSAAVNFVMPSSSSAVLNRVANTGGQSYINGQLTSNGQVYLINPNGILFGSTSSVNVNTLIASSLGIGNDLFLKGILSITNGDASFLGDSISGLVQVENGAVITAATGGKVMMFAPAINNNGLIQTPDGQTLLAAGQKVYLYASSDPNMRGLLVELDNGGKTQNLDLGRIVAERGNVTLAGIAINQNGRVRATTSLISNGSITLKAQDTTNTRDLNSIPGVVRRRPEVAGEVVLGSGSLTEVLLDATDTSSVLDSVTVNKSLIDIEAKNIHFQSDALIIAPGAQVNLIAIYNPSSPTIVDAKSTVTANDSHIYFEQGSGIDVSGIGSGSSSIDRVGEVAAQVSVATNVVEAELRSNELKDSPLQRSGILKAAKVFVDARVTAPDGSVGTSVADVSGYISQIKHGLSERMASGGSVKIQSEGDIVFAPNAFIDVSGGKVVYTGGIVNKTTLLGLNGLSYDIASASKDLTYTDIQNVNYYESGYVAGRDAGSILFSAPAMVLEGKLNGGIILGERQRALGSMPNGATLQIGQNKVNPTDTELLKATYILHSDLVLDASHISGILPTYQQSYSLSQAQQQTLTLGSNFTAPSGFKNLLFYADGQITLRNGTNLNASLGGNVTLSGGGVDVQGSIFAHSGIINLSSKVMTSYIGQRSPFNANAQNNVELGGSTALDVSGLWTNDLLMSGSNDLIARNGGSINISASSLLNYQGNVILNTGSTVNASGGAWLQSNGKLSAGNAGSIALLASDGISDGLTQIHSGRLTLNGTLRADSLATGGSLSLSSGSITIGSNALGGNGETLINPIFFQKGGFTTYKINGFEGLVVEDNVTIAPIALTRVLDRTYQFQQGGQDIQSFSNLNILPATNAAVTRNATSLSLSASGQWNGILSLGSGSKIVTDPGASVSLVGKRQLTVLGSILAPGGNISMTSGLVSGEKTAVDFNSDQTLWLGEQSVLDVSGVVSSYINALGLTVGSVQDAGSIVLNATKGEVIAKAGAQLKLDGNHSLLNVKSGNTFILEDVASKGGSLSISSREGVFWDASMSAHGGNQSVSAGNFLFSVPLLDLDSVTGSNASNDYNYPIGPREIIIKSQGSSLPDSLRPGDTIDIANNGKSYIFADKLKSAGFDSIAITKSDTIRFDETLTLSARGSINLDAPNISLNNGVEASINASYVSMGNGQVMPSVKLAMHQTPIDPAVGDGILRINADFINLYGQQNLHNVAIADFNSKGDIQLSGVLQDPSESNHRVPLKNPVGILQTAGDTSFTAARIYPSSLSDYSLLGLGANSTFTFNRSPSGRDSGVPFSALGVLNVEAKTIVQNGVLRAPFGVINLKASDRLTLSDNSLTSVSAEGLTMPFGSTLNLRYWNFDEGNDVATLSTLPDKKINLEGNFVDISSGSKVDLSGGGDLVAWEFTPGTGGSKDVLSGLDVFAILPQFKAGYMPGNSESYNNSALKAGDSIYLSGGNGLAAGQYMLLPAHYALLPGAYSVKLVAGTQNFGSQQNMLNADGSMLVSGYRMGYGGLVADAGSHGFLVASGNIARTQSEFTYTLASNFYKSAYSNAELAGYRLTDDAGLLAIKAVNDFVFDGEMMLSGKKDKLGQLVGRNAEVDISSSQIAISGDQTLGAAGYLTLSSIKLNSLGAESLLIGGKRTNVASGTQLDVTASNVELVGGASLKGQEVILVANDKVVVGLGTSVEASGLPTTNISKLIIGNDGVADSNGIITGAVSGDGALLRVSSGVQRDLIRRNVASTMGEVDLKGSLLNAKSVILDATNANKITGSVDLLTGGSLSVGAPIISFGTASNSVGLIYNEITSALVAPSDLQLKSYATLEFSGDVVLGDITGTHSISLQGKGMNYGPAGAGKVTINAELVRLSGLNNDAFVPGASLGSGTLEINAKEIVNGSNTFHTAGFSAVQFNAKQFTGQEVGGLDVDGDLIINAERITSASLSDQTIHASGAITTLINSSSAFGVIPAASKPALGGKLTLIANAIDHGGNIEMPAGIVTLKATGIGDSLVINSESKISAKGSVEMLGSVPVLVDGGKIILETTKGNIRLEPTSLIDVSATGGANAGLLSIHSAGTADVFGTINGSAVVGNGLVNPTQGSFEYHAATLNDHFSDLNALLEAGRFNESRNIHVSQGDLTLAIGETVVAHNVTLTTDDGNILINGQINASGTKGGIVRLSAGQKNNDGQGNITLASGSKIDASATFASIERAGSIGHGGKVSLITMTDIDTSPASGSGITLAADSEIDLTGKGLGPDGTLILRAPRTGMNTSADAGTGVAVTILPGAKVLGNNTIIMVEGVKTYTSIGDLSIDAFAVSNWEADNTNFTKTPYSDSRVFVSAGIEVRSSGDINVVDNIDFNTWAPGSLTLRAAGDVNVLSNISAGFTSSTSGILTNDSTNLIPGYHNGGNWTYHIVAGADLHSADLMTTLSTERLATTDVATGAVTLKGDFTLGANNILRTGIGDIEIVAGHNLNLASDASVIYTAGVLDYQNYGNLINNPYGIKAQYSNNGGDIKLIANGQINGAYTTQVPVNWQFRQGNNNVSYQNDTSWWTSFKDFKENIGALAGGDVNINAGGNITNLSAIIATNGRVYDTLKGQLGTGNAELVVNGGGDLTIRSGGDISGGIYMVDKGNLIMRADGGLLPGIIPSDSTMMATAFALGDGKIDVKTLGTLNLNTVFNPPMSGMSKSNLTALEASKYTSFFSTYSPNSAVSFTSVSSGINVVPDMSIFARANLQKVSASNLFPGSLTLAALGGDLNVEGSAGAAQLGLMPAAKGDLKLAASGSIYLDAAIHMSDNNINLMPTAFNPVQLAEFKNVLNDKILNTFTKNSALSHDSIPVHQNDTQSVYISAGNDIVGTGSVSLFLPKKADIYAGNDIINLALLGQNLNSVDQTSIIAGRDILNPKDGAAGIMWGGPGYLDVVAGRNIDLNTSDGIVTRGNLDNPFLPETGANLSISVGVASTNNQAFIAKYLNPLVSNIYSESLVKFIRTSKDLKTEDLLSVEDAWTIFDAMDLKLKNKFVETVFFNELKQAGLDHNDQTSKGYGNYDRGFEAISTLFPNNTYNGKLDLSFSQLKTERGGNLNIFAPGGGIVVGLPVIPQSIKDAKQANGQNPDAKLGIFTVRNGDINAFAKSDIEVAQSREFTIAGGDILDWSSTGNIDAGKGSKTATSAPPPLIRIDPQGNTIVDLSGVVSGSGIGTLQTLANAPLGNVYLIAPTGTVDAGDAGVRSSGNLLVAAQTVANGANMQAAGATSGVPAPSTANVSFNLPVSADSSNNSKQGEKLSDAASKTANNKEASLLPSLITVEVLALGCDSGSSSDQNCDEKTKSKKQ